MFVSNNKFIFTLLVDKYLLRRNWHKVKLLVDFILTFHVFPLPRENAFSRSVSSAGWSTAFDVIFPFLRISPSLSPTVFEFIKFNANSSYFPANHEPSCLGFHRP